MKAVAPEQNNGVSMKTNGPWSWYDASLAQVSPHRVWDKEPANALVEGTGQNDGVSVKTNGPWSWNDESLAQVSIHRVWDKEPATAGAGVESEGTGQNDGVSVKTNGPWSWHNVSLAQVSHHLVCDKNPANAGGGDTAMSYLYTLYGETSITLGTDTATKGNRFTDTARERETASMLFYRSRYYNSTQGWFYSKDVYRGDYERPLSQNKFLYVEGSPVNYSDPNGLCFPGSEPLSPILHYCPPGFHWDDLNGMCISDYHIRNELGCDACNFNRNHAELPVYAEWHNLQIVDCMDIDYSTRDKAVTQNSERGMNACPGNRHHTPRVHDDL